MCIYKFMLSKSYTSYCVSMKNNIKSYKHNMKCSFRVARMCQLLLIYKHGIRVQTPGTWFNLMRFIHLRSHYGFGKATLHNMIQWKTKSFHWFTIWSVAFWNSACTDPGQRVVAHWCTTKQQRCSKMYDL